MLQFSGKRISALSKKLEECGLHVIGQDPASDPRDKIANLLNQEIANLKRVPSLNTDNPDDVFAFANEYGFPILIGGMNEEIKQKILLLSMMFLRLKSI